MKPTQNVSCLSVICSKQRWLRCGHLLQGCLWNANHHVDFLKYMLMNFTDNTAIAVVLAIAIAILLCILVYCFMKGRKKSQQHHRVAVNNTPVTSLEDRERLVYNTTTKPIWALAPRLWQTFVQWLTPVGRAVSFTELTQTDERGNNFRSRCLNAGEELFLFCAYSFKVNVHSRQYVLNDEMWRFITGFCIC